ncbi:MAG: hypothetical protein A2720_00510 [Candidatus Doudnabacteria bacterium RIFCSPHIGHO2_01_FULL_46_24]|uniref:Uncharacterized protein n=1 Tax=Candidatus Doudnabacteria bacterium RIFCSPHIGHO2_01_FULL_46_24 TaxID=1817825 RepID=A0A1F5NTK9_9BACT|nr:MAG: hypothetical protein A2720_00510 [Candidatus Doudnabacteria bacterium RIFCSPHIGHO2_01_FULL_46_24]
MGGKLFAHERQTASACPIEGRTPKQNLLLPYLIFLWGTREIRKLEKKILLRRSPAKGGARRHFVISYFQKFLIQ